MIRAGHKVASTQTTPLTAAKRMTLWDMIQRSDSATARALAQTLPLQDQLRASVARTAHERPVMSASVDVPSPAETLARVQSTELAPVVPQDKMQILGDVIAPGLSPEQLEVFAIACNRTRLDPFAKQICAVTRWDSDLGRNKMTIQTTIDGFRVIAERTGKYGGRKPFEWCGKDGAWREVWLESEAPAAARARILRKDFAEPLVAIARYKAYCATKKDGKPTYMWTRMDAEQLAKCAEALALRTAFPQELSGLYTDDEMAQADARMVEATVVQSPKPTARPAANGGKPPERAQAPAAVQPAAAPAKPTQQQMAEKVDGPRFARSFPTKTWAGKPMRDAPCEVVLDYIQYCEAVLADQSRQDAHKSAATSKAQAEGIYNEIVEREMAEAQARFETSTVPPAIDPITAGLQAEFDRTRNPAHATGIGDDNLPDSWSR